MRSLVFIKGNRGSERLVNWAHGHTQNEKKSQDLNTSLQGPKLLTFPQAHTVSVEKAVGIQLTEE